MFDRDDILQIERHGLSVETVEKQLENFKHGFPPLSIVRAASPYDGVVILGADDLALSVETYENAVDNLKVVKFVPASGAATRMFKELFEYLNEGKRGRGIDVLMDNIEDFAFYQELQGIVNDFSDTRKVVDAIINDGLNYGSKPKGLVSFHKYGTEVRKAVEEHLVEGAQYASSGGLSRIHFTVSPEHENEFRSLLLKCVPEYELKFGVKYDISFSLQKASTDTIAVTTDNKPFRADDGKLLFRPAGHGALIENLNEIDADIIFIKNIDNVTTDELRADTIKYKKALAGMLLDKQYRTFEYLRLLREGVADINVVADFVINDLGVLLPDKYDSAMIEKILDRPIRVCGMVRNVGEPGGGPFWVKNEDGTTSLQIAESSQISAEDMSLMKCATHFNPVDLVCGVRRYDGSKFDLKQFVEPSTGFITSKSSGGRSLQAQELPGLWNGAMAYWNTIFVDVPISTFSPVKVVQDLLREQHR